MRIKHDCNVESLTMKCLDLQLTNFLADISIVFLRKIEITTNVFLEFFFIELNGALHRQLRNQSSGYHSIPCTSSDPCYKHNALAPGLCNFSFCRHAADASIWQQHPIDFPAIFSQKEVRRHVSAQVLPSCFLLASLLIQRLGRDCQ